MPREQDEVVRTGDIGGVSEAMGRIAEFVERCGGARPSVALDVEGRLDLDNLSLRSEDLRILAPPLSNLANLTALDLSRNGLTADAAFAEALAMLPGVKRLDLSHNRLTSTEFLSRALTPLAGLERLSLSYNQLRSDDGFLRAVGPRATLKRLGLRYNELIANRVLVEALSSLDQLEYLALHGNPLEQHAGEATQGGLPGENGPIAGPLHQIPTSVIASEDAPVVVRALRDFVQDLARPNPEFRVVILGRGRVGKTLLRHRLMGRSVNKHEVEPATRSFEIESLPAEFRPTCPRVFMAVPSEAEQLRGIVHVFDFGGQDALWASHRFFIGAKRTVFAVCVSRNRTPDDSRLAFWLRYIERMREEEVQTEVDAMAKSRGAGAEGGSWMGEADIRAAIEADIPKPPVVVVSTDAPGDSSEAMRRESRRRVSEECSAREARLVDPYDNHEAGEDGLRQVRDELQRALRSEAMKRRWTELWPRAQRDRLARMREWVDAGSAKMMDMTDYLGSVCGIELPAGASPTGAASTEVHLALADLREMRRLGIVHWVGDHPDVEDTERVRDIIFSPRAIRDAVYNVLWAEPREANPLTRAQVMDELLGRARGADPTDLTTPEAELVLRLMEVCELVFRGESFAARPRPQYLVPDRLPAGSVLNTPNDTSSNDLETVLRTDLEFIPDMLMPRLIGQLWTKYACAAMTRCSCAVEWRAESGLVPVKLHAEQASGVFRASVLAASERDLDRVRWEIEGMLTSLLRRAERPVVLDAVSTARVLGRRQVQGTVPGYTLGRSAAQQGGRAGPTPRGRGGPRTPMLSQAARKARDAKTLEGLGDLLEEKKWLSRSDLPRVASMTDRLFQFSREHLNESNRQLVMFRLVWVLHLLHTSKGHSPGPTSSEAARSLIEACEPWVEPVRARLIVHEDEYLGAAGHGANRWKASARSAEHQRADFAKLTDTTADGFREAMKTLTARGVYEPNTGVFKGL